MEEDQWFEIIKGIKKIEHRLVPKNFHQKNQTFESNLNSKLYLKLKIPKFHTLTPKKNIHISPVDVTLDLHGLTKTQAYEALESFLKQAFQNGKKHALVITGKGKEDNPGVIKLEVPRWLQFTDLKKYIISYSSAKSHLGGEGAISIMLKQKKI